MGRFKRDYALYRRATKGGRAIYYCRFRGEDEKSLTAVSTGCTDRRKAEAWANRQLREGIVVTKRSLTFGTFADGWWANESPYVRSRRARGFTLSPGYLATMRTNLERHVLPAFGQHRVASITPTDVETWRLSLFEEGRLSPRTINLATRVLSVMLAEAVQRGFAARNPAAGIGKLAERPSARGVMTLDEVRALFDDKATRRVWGDDHRHRALNMVGAASGLRLGEALGLRREDIFADHAVVRRAWRRQHGWGPPKSDSDRVVPLPKTAVGVIQRALEMSPFDEPVDLIFHGTDREKPLGHKVVLSRLYLALEKIGIDEEERRARSISYHSWRHGLTTQLRARGVPDGLVKSVTGHRTDAMVLHYGSHFHRDDYSDVLKAQAAMLDAG